MKKELKPNHITRFDALLIKIPRKEFLAAAKRLENVEGDEVTISNTGVPVGTINLYASWSQTSPKWMKSLPVRIL